MTEGKLHGKDPSGHMVIAMGYPWDYNPLIRIKRTYVLQNLPINLLSIILLVNIPLRN